MKIWCLKLHLALVLCQYLNFSRNGSHLNKSVELACFWTGLFLNWPVSNWPVFELACFHRPEKQADRTGLKIRPVFQADKTGLKLRTGLQMNSPLRKLATVCPCCFADAFSRFKLFNLFLMLLTRAWPPGPPGSANCKVDPLGLQVIA